MHHDCGSSFRILPALSLTGRREIFSLCLTPTPRAQRTLSHPLAYLSSTSSLPPLPLICRARPLATATASTEVQPVERQTTEVQNASPTTSKKARSVRGSLAPSPKAFQIQLTNLPVSEQFVDHSGVFPTLPWHFSTLVSDVFRSYCQKKSIDELRHEFAEETDAAHTVWTTHTLDSLTNWADYTLDSHLRVRNVVCLLVGSILTSAQQIIHVLNTLKPLDNDFAVRAHCLYLTGFLYKSELLRDQVLLRMYDAEVHKLRLTSRWPQPTMSLDHMRMLVWRTDGAQLKPLLLNLRQKYPNMSVWTLLYLTMFCSRNGMPDEAFSFFDTIEPHFLQNPPTLLLQCCSQLLNHDYVVHTAAGPNFCYLPPLLEKGLAPDSLLYTRIIERALASDYPGVAWDIYHHLHTTNITIDWRTYRLLLRQAFNSRDVKGVDEIMTHIHQQKELYTNPRLLMYAMNMVRRINHSSGRTTVHESLSHILALYERAYTKAPLAIFGLASNSEHKAPTRKVAEPTTYVVSFTVWASILCHKHGRSVHTLWARIKHLVEDGNHTVLECMKLDLIYNAFIWLHLKRFETISDALEVFQYMLDKQFCLPTARTWSIMICGFLHLGQRDQAKQIYDLMCEHGFTIDNICGEYVSGKISLDDLERRAHEVLDEQSMPDGTDLHWTGDPSPPSPLREPQDALHEHSFGYDVEPGDMLYDLGTVGQPNHMSNRIVAAQ